jgi:MFS family permease
MNTLSNIFQVYKRPHIWAISCLSFSGGLPFLLIVSTLPIWLKDVSCSIEQISYIFLVSAPYSLKFLWAPFIDQYTIPILSKKLGHRRSWALFSQVFLFISTLLLAHSHPEKNIHITALLAFLMSFFAATQDIVLDAYRIERLTKEELGIGTSLSGVGFRLGMLTSGAGTIYLSHYYSWKMIYTIAALLGFIGMLVIAFVKEPEKTKIDNSTKDIYKIQEKNFLSYIKIVAKSFLNIRRHENWQYIILFIFLFKIGDAIPNSMGSLFFMDVGFSKLQIGDAKTVGIIMMIIGSIIGGVIVAKHSIFKSIFLCGIIQVASPLAMYGMTFAGHSETVLLVSQGIQCAACGIGSIAFVTYLSSLCSGGFTATQFSVLYSFSSISRIILSSGSGWILGYSQCSWSTFFLYTTLLSALFIGPVLVLSGLSLKNQKK